MTSQYERAQRFASMRPRQSSLGIPVQRDTRASHAAASMRPRQSSLGIRDGTTEGEWDAACFNEAEAIKPRNLGNRLRRLRRCGRFNEAEAIKPRNLRLAKSYLVEDAKASMRPRQSSLGIRSGGTSSRSRPACFNEAEAIKPRNHGRGFFVVH